MSGTLQHIKLGEVDVTFSITPDNRGQQYVYQISANAPMHVYDGSVLLEGAYQDRQITTDKSVYVVIGNIAQVGLSGITQREYNLSITWDRSFALCLGEHTKALSWPDGERHVVMTIVPFDITIAVVEEQQ